MPQPRMSSPIPRASRTSARLALASALVLVASLAPFASQSPAAASAPLPTAPLPAAIVRDELAALTVSGPPLRAREPLTPAQRFLRFTAILQPLDALAPAETLSALRQLASPATDPASSRAAPGEIARLLSARAALELAERADGPAPLGLAESALVASSVDPAGDLDDRHAAFVALGAAALGPAATTTGAPSPDLGPPIVSATPDPAPAPPTPAEGRLRWSHVSRGPPGALALDPFVPGAAQGATQDALLHLVIAFDVSVPFRGSIRLAATGDLAATLAPVPDPPILPGQTGPAGPSPSVPALAIPLGEVRALQRAVIDQVAAPVELAPGRYVLLVTLRPNRSEPALLRARLDPIASIGPSEPVASSSASPPVSQIDSQLVPRPSAPDRVTWITDLGPATPLRDNPAVLALGDRFEATFLRRLLGLPDLAPTARAPRPTLEERLRRDLDRTSPVALLLALSAVPKDEDRASLLLAAALSTPTPLLHAALADSASGRGQLVAARIAYDRALAAVRDEGVAPRPSPPLADLLRFIDARLARLAHNPEGALRAYDLAAPALAAPQAQALTSGLAERDRLELAQACLELGRADLAVALYDGLLADLPGRLDLSLALARAAEAAGLPDRAIAVSRAAALRRPDRPALALEAARKLIARARPDDLGAARSLVDLALAGLGSRPDGRVMAARLLESLGDRNAAAQVLADVLVSDPAHAEARRNLERLVGAQPIPLTLSLDEVAKTPTLDPDQSFEVLGEELFIQLRPDGSASRWTRRILRAQSVPEQRDAKTLRVRFDPTQESVRVLGAFVHRPQANGRGFDTRPVSDRLLQSISEDWYGLYYDLRQLAVPFDHIQRGDLLEVTWRSDAVGQLFPGVVDVFEVLSDRVPKHLQRIVVDAPPGITLQTRLSRPPGASFPSDETTTPRPGGGTRHTFVARDLPALPSEGSAPGAAEVAPVWQATTFRSWREVAIWYRRLIEPQRVLSPAMKAFVAEAMAGSAPPTPAGSPAPQPLVRGATPGGPAPQPLVRGATPGEVLARLFDYVTREVRYVGLEFGIHGVKPYRSDLVWSRRFGDCKDKATLLSVLLAEAGLRGEVTLVRTRKQGRLDGALPSLSLFDHAVVWLPTRDELVDPTALHFGLGELPRDDQGAQILVLGRPEDPLDLAISKVDPPARNGVAGTWIVTLDPRGRAGIQGTVSFLGTQAPYYRALLLDPAAQGQRLAELMNRRYPGLSLREFRISPPTDRSRPFDLVFHAEVPVLAQVDGRRLIVPRPTGLDGQVDRFATEESRALPLVMGPPMRFAVTYRYVLPEGFRALELPAGGAGQGPFGAYQVAWVDEGPVVSVTAELSYTVDQVSPSDYPALRDFVRGFDAIIATPLVLERIPAPAPTPEAP